VTEVRKWTHSLHKISGGALLEIVVDNTINTII